MPQAKPKTLAPDERAEAVRRWRAWEQAQVLQQAAGAHYQAFAKILAAKYKIPQSKAVLNLQRGEISRNGRQKS